MQYWIDHQQKFNDVYTREQVQYLINTQQIDVQTKITTKEWNEWKRIKNTDFDLSKAKFKPDSGLPDDLIFSIRWYLDYIDNGWFFRHPFSWLYALIAILNLLFPIWVLYKGFDMGVFDQPNKILGCFIFTWVILASSAWFSFQIWWDRRLKVQQIVSDGEGFIATPVFSHFIQTFGEWMGTYVGFVGFLISITMFLFLGEDADWITDRMGMSILSQGLIVSLFIPVLGFMTVVITRFLAESMGALAAVANNTGKKQ